MPAQPPAPAKPRLAVSPVPDVPPSKSRAPGSRTPPPPGKREPIDPSLPPDYPLEPGSGTPRMSASAADRIAASEAALAGTKSATSANPTNYIAAARRAAQAALPSAGAAAPSAEEKPKPKSIGQRMRKFLAGAGVILIVLGGYKIATNTLTSFQPDIQFASEPPAQLAADATETDDDDEEPAIEQPQSRPSDVANVKPALPAWIASTGSPAVTGSIPSPSRPAAAAPLGLPIIPESSSQAASLAKLPPALRTAAASGDPVAAYEIAMRFVEGRGVPVALDEAARWFQRAAKAGLAPAQFRLGSLYEKGQGVKKNIDAARQLYLAAAERGNARAMHNLAVLYAEGGSGKPDYKTAGLWFRKAAEHGLADSQYNLGILYARGIGVEQNLPESYKWFSLAAAQGDKDSAKKRDDVAARLDAGALKASRLAVEAFVAAPQPDDAAIVKMPQAGWEQPASVAKPKKRSPATAPMKIAPT
jgi:localization factor PodJL